MKSTCCPYEERVSRSARTGIWDDSTRAHVSECAHCREIVQIARFLEKSARFEESRPSLPDAEQIWLNSRYDAMQAARERALRPLMIAQRMIRLAVLLILTGGIVWISFSFPTMISQWLPRFRPISQPMLISTTGIATLLVALLLTRLIQPLLFDD
jgi:predicted anti-sigma-YlaC factor YlaD